MPKTITSPSKRWTGTVTLAEPLFLPQAEAIDMALQAPPGYEEKATIPYTALDKWHFPAILACVEKWNLAGFPDPVTIETIPMTPRPESHALIEWIFLEIKKIYIGEQEIPNE
jgi:hypothetical protein